MATSDQQVESENTQCKSTEEDETPFTIEGLCDDEVTLLFDDGQKLFVSRNFLCLTSPVFMKMFNSEIKEKKSGTVELKGKTYENTLEFLLVLHPFEDKYITDHNIYNIVSLAEEYHVKKLIQKCQKKFDKKAIKESATILEEEEEIFGVSTRQERQKIDAVASCFQILSIAALYGYRDLEEKLITILGKIGPKVYYRYFKSDIGIFNEIEEEKDDDGNEDDDDADEEDCHTSLFYSNSWDGRIKEISREHDKCMKAFESLSDKTKLKLTLKRIRYNDNNKML